ncbi:MAG: methionine--tRNA ligase subunit beta, partial [Schwartzia sp.]|nr:methionine--tRNA ligase subunit beta [Schwartzia sp. (in: firmicutes)]
KAEKNNKDVKSKGNDDEISIEDFTKIHLRVVKVQSVERMEGTDKLLKLKVDLGTEQREIVSGIAEHYKPDDLVGKTVVMVINLKPTKIRGILSQGMILTAYKGDEMKVLDVDMPIGSRIK